MNSRRISLAAGILAGVSALGVVIAGPAYGTTPKVGKGCLRAEVGKTYTTTSPGHVIQCVAKGTKYVWADVLVTASTIPPATFPATTLPKVRELYHTDFYKLGEFPEFTNANGGAGYRDEKYQITATNTTGEFVNVPGVTGQANVGLTMTYRVTGRPAVYLACYDTGKEFLVAGIREGVAERSFAILRVTQTGVTELASAVLPLTLQAANQTQVITIVCTGTPGGPGAVALRYAGTTVGQVNVGSMPPGGAVGIYVSGPGTALFDNLLVATV